jgi:hypothetical protein
MAILNAAAEVNSAAAMKRGAPAPRAPGHIGRWRRGLVFVLAVALGGSVPGEAALPTEYEVKAAFMYHFVKFVEWPAPRAQQDTFVVGVLGDDPFGPLLDHTFAGKKAVERSLVVKRLAHASEAKDVDLLFIAASESARLPQVLTYLEGQPVLTVSEIDGFVGRGGMVGFRLEREMVRFDIDLDKVAQAGLKMSSQLVRVARKVVSTRPGGS